jgi:hypothetical protein
MPGLPTASLKTLVGTVLVCAPFVIVYGFLGIPPHPFIHLVVSLAPLVAAISWLKADARARHVPLVHDMGLFLWIAWPVLIPWYAFKTRGRHGLPLALLVMLAIITPGLLVVLIEVAQSFRAR